MTLNTYDVGESVELIGRFKDPDTKLPESPDTVTVTIYRPVTLAEVAVPPVPVEAPAGTFTAVFAPDTPGRWRWRMEGTGGVTAIERGEFHVRPDAPDA